MSIALMVHGGASSIPAEQSEDYKRGCLAALEAGWTILERGGSALDAVEAAIRILEDDPTFNAGRGSALNADGVVEMDAGIMEGQSLGAGAVAAIQGVRHPISVARQVLENESVLLVGERRAAFCQRAWR